RLRPGRSAIGESRWSRPVAGARPRLYLDGRSRGRRLVGLAVVGGRPVLSQEVAIEERRVDRLAAAERDGVEGERGDLLEHLGVLDRLGRRRPPRERPVTGDERAGHARGVAAAERLDDRRPGRLLVLARN